MSKYLNGDPLPWLMEETDHSVRYITNRDILSDPGYKDQYNNLFKAPEVQNLLDGAHNGILGSPKNFDIYYKGTMWCFAETVERGLDRQTDIVNTTAEFLLNHCQLPSGGFTLNWNPRVEVACRTGDMIKYLVMAGFGQDTRIQKGIQWILMNQRHDSGWLHCPISGVCDQLRLIFLKKPGKGLRRESSREVPSCIYATIACSMALTLYRINTRSDECNISIEKAAEFFLNNSLFIGNHYTTKRLPNNLSSDLRSLGYPVMTQYDILYGLIFIAQAGRFADSRTGEAFNHIMMKQNDDGTWNLENTDTGMLHGGKGRHSLGGKDKWVTLNAMRLLKSISGNKS